MKFSAGCGLPRSWCEALEGSIMPLVQGNRTRRPTNSKEARLVTEDTPPTNDGVPEDTPDRQDVDVLLDVSELEVEKIKLTVRGLRAHVSVLAELASLVNLQVGVDARLDEVELEIDGVRAKVLLKVRLALPYALIHRSAWKPNSGKSAYGILHGSTPRAMRGAPSASDPEELNTLCCGVA
jgi:hypothetical protein